ncbi:hypothetical protein FN846DRAFT_954659 [Sphaerosporella brunnea]|uniref:Transmembrane protein n=1 Tax=Sphaerosporella brunnea TaxID=1250544 RepID=A0A5J5ETQ3_9PEZI|nr:hypothetical protein FN846DRAFT_954659 [Sphaerosporella brunnea]
MASPHNRKRLSCKREKNACYVILSLLFLFCGLIFGLSFLPKLQGTNTRVHLWVLSCSLFIITSTVVLFLVTFCTSCRLGCRRPKDLEGDAADDNEKLDDGAGKADSPSPSNTHQEAANLQQFHSTTIENDRPSLEIAPVDGSERGFALSPIDEESIDNGEEETDYQSNILTRGVASKLDSLDFPESPYSSEPTYPRPVVMPVRGIVLTEEEQLWEFERNWKPWNRKSDPAETDSIST